MTEREELLPCQKPINFRHGHTIDKTYTPTYHSWQAMMARCRYAERDTENKYINRGISVCLRWLQFENFLADMGERPPGKTLDRKDNLKGYAPDNCKWSTPVEQARNRRNTRLNFDQAFDIAVRMLNGEKASLISKQYGVSESLPREIHKGRTWKDAYAAARA